MTFTPSIGPGTDTSTMLFGRPVPHRFQSAQEANAGDSTTPPPPPPPNLQPGDSKTVTANGITYTWTEDQNGNITGTNGTDSFTYGANPDPNHPNEHLITETDTSGNTSTYYVGTLTNAQGGAMANYSYGATDQNGDVNFVSSYGKEFKYVPNGDGTGTIYNDQTGGTNVTDGHTSYGRATDTGAHVTNGWHDPWMTWGL